MASTFSEFHTNMSQRPPKFCPKTKKYTTIFIIERFEVSKGSNRFDLTLLSPLASLQTNTNLGPHWTTTGIQVPAYIR